MLTFGLIAKLQLRRWDIQLITVRLNQIRVPGCPRPLTLGAAGGVDITTTADLPVITVFKPGVFAGWYRHSIRLGRTCTRLSLTRLLGASTASSRAHMHT